MLLVACLCAAWCGTCREFRPLFEAGAAQARFVWVDIEDRADVLGDLDVDDFPTLLIARDGEPLFFGPVTPHAGTLARLVDRAATGGLEPLGDAEVRALAARVAADLEDGARSGGCRSA